MCFCFRWNWCCLCFSFRVSFSFKCGPNGAFRPYNLFCNSNNNNKII
jgi:hypothetical protein